MVVVDASVVLDSAFGEGNASEVDRVMVAVSTQGGLVPQHWRLEVANAFATRLRNGRLERMQANLIAEALEKLAVETDACTGDKAWTETLDLAARYDLTVYDAACLELAQRRAAPLATFDKALIRAALSAGVALI